MSYRRNIKSYLVDLLEKYPVVAIVGARQVGKTTLAKHVGHDFYYMDLEKGSDYDKFTSDPEFFFKLHSSKVIFDEAQLVPLLFSTLRSVIDENRQQMGRFILTGSSSPELLKNISESLAGRIAIIELGTLKINEIMHKPLSDFYEIFKKPLDKNNVQLGQPHYSMQQLRDGWLKGGYPEPISKSLDFYSEWFIDYETSYINRDIAALFPKLDRVAYRRFINMLGKLSSKIINKSDLARSIGVSEPSIRQYLEIADGTFLWRQLPSFENSATKSCVKMPKGHLRDSGLLHHLLQINSLEALQNDPIAGFSFEAFLIEEILKGLQDARIRNINAYYFRTRSGAEVDLMLQGTFGLLPIEIKYGTTILQRNLRSLSDFIAVQQLPFGLVISQNENVEWLTEKILHVPANYL